MTQILEIVTSDISRDVRVQKTATSLVEFGYDVSVLSLSNRLNDKNFPFEIIETKQELSKINTGIWNFNLINNIIKGISKYHLKKVNVLFGEEINPRELQFFQKFIQSGLIFGYTLGKNFLLYQLAKKIKADIYHANDLDALLTALLLKREHGGKIIYDSHELYCDQWVCFDPFFYNIFKNFEYILIKECDGVITVNESIANILQSRYNLAKKPTVVMNCPQLSISESSIKIHNKSRIIYIGGYLPGRNLENIIYATKYMDEPIYLRGFGSLESKLRKIAQNNKYNVQFLDPVPPENLVESLREFDIGIIPYQPINLNNLYSTPNKFFEYLHAGLAIASSDIPELKKIIENEKIGSIFNSGDPKSIADVLNGLVSGDLLRYRENAIRCSKEKYNWEFQKEKLLKLYCSIE